MTDERPKDGDILGLIRSASYSIDFFKRQGMIGTTGLSANQWVGNLTESGVGSYNYNVEVHYYPKSEYHVTHAVRFRDFLDSKGIPYTESPSREEVAAVLRDTARQTNDLADKVEGVSEDGR